MDPDIQANAGSVIFIVTKRTDEHQSKYQFLLTVDTSLDRSSLTPSSIRWLERLDSTTAGIQCNLTASICIT